MPHSSLHSSLDTHAAPATRPRLLDVVDAVTVIFFSDKVPNATIKSNMG